MATVRRFLKFSLRLVHFDIVLLILFRILLLVQLLLGGLPNEIATLVANISAAGEEPPAVIGPVVVTTQQPGRLSRTATAVRNSKKRELDAGHGDSPLADAGDVIDKGFGEDGAFFLFIATLEQNVGIPGSWGRIHGVLVRHINLVFLLAASIVVVGGHFHFAKLLDVVGKTTANIFDGGPTDDLARSSDWNVVAKLLRCDDTIVGLEAQQIRSQAGVAQMGCGLVPIIGAHGFVGRIDSEGAKGLHRVLPGRDLVADLGLLVSI